jgi:hypothetical protein
VGRAEVPNNHKWIKKILYIIYYIYHKIIMMIIIMGHKCKRETVWGESVGGREGEERVLEDRRTKVQYM